MLALRVIEGGKTFEDEALSEELSREEFYSSPEWEEIKKELREIEIEIRNRLEDREKELNKNISFHLSKKNRESLFDLLSRSPWLSTKEIAEKFSVTERIIAMTLKKSWADGIYCRRGVMARGTVKYLWAVEGTLPY
tara:strand:+ start:105 stop:515 length:411 start_codon:yes stop_codon:yes gene_type:complete